MPSTFITADTHFGHANVIHHSGRPWQSIEEHDEALIRNWNNMVGKGDLVYIIGDFAWRDHAHYIQALHGKKTLIVGTHDKMSHVTEQNFTSVVGGRHKPGVLEILVDKCPITLCHYPLSTWNGSCYGSWHFHGHSHGGTPEQPDYLRCDVGVDVWSYLPVPWEVLKLKMESRIEAWKERRKRLSATSADHQLDITNLKIDNREWLEKGKVYAGYLNVSEQKVSVEEPVLSVQGCAG